MVSVSGVDVKFGRILLMIGVGVGFILLYKYYGSGTKDTELSVKTTSSTKSDKNAAAGDSAQAGSANALDDEDSGGESDEIEGQGSGTNVAPQHAKIEVIPDLEVKEVKLTVDKNNCTLTYLEVKPEKEDEKKPKLLLLHGAAFSASTWNNDTGTLSQVRKWGYRAVAVDVKDKQTDPCTGSLNDGRASLIHNIVVALKLEKVVLVSPSKSGSLSIPYIMNINFHKEIAAFIPIAPLIEESFTSDRFKKLDKLTTLIVQGVNDHSSQIHTLEDIPNHEEKIIPDAGHSCYKDQPEVWHTILKEFLDKLTATN